MQRQDLCHEGTRVSEQRGRWPILALLTGNAVSLVGNRLTDIAVPWFVLQTTGSPAKTGLTAATVAASVILAGALGGTFVDHLGFKRASVTADLTSGITIALIPLLFHTVGLAFWQFLVLVFLASLLDAPGWTARESLLPDLAKMANLRFERANSAYQMIENGAQLVGPSLAGVLIATLGPSNVLWVDAATFAVSALIITGAVPPARPAIETS